MACSGVDDASSAMAATAAPAEVDVAKLKAIMDTQKVALIDVRTAAEFAEGHAPGAVNIPVGELDTRMSELEPHKSAAVYLICRSGSRSARAQTQLLAAGFFRPINVVGGTLAWRAAGHPVE
jgi:rhodanese-related sulfurtransferase